MSVVYTLEQVVRDQGLSAHNLAFCQALLTQGEVLAVHLSYFPESLVWLVSTRAQARLLRAHAREPMILTLVEAQDLLTAAGSPHPMTLWEAAASLVAPAPGAPEWPDEPGPKESDPSDPEDGWPVP